MLVNMPVKALRIISGPELRIFLFAEMLIGRLTIRMVGVAFDTSTEYGVVILVAAGVMRCRRTGRRVDYIGDGY